MAGEQSSTRDDELIAQAARQVARVKSFAPHAPRGSTFGAQAAEVSGEHTLRAEEIPGYQIIGERQRGGQGVVYEAIQLATRRRVAIKVQHESHSADPARARFEREVEILAGLRHPNIVTIHDSSRTDRRLFYVMDFIDGVPFDQFAAAVPERDPQQILRVFGKICDAVHAAHLRGVMHRDLKPSNILVDSVGEPRVLDFGLAKALEADGHTAPAEMTETGQFLGSLHWAAPEQLLGQPDRVDLRCDVYSLGVVLFKALTGSMPYPAPTSFSDVARQIRETDPLRPSTLRRELNDEIDTILLKCLQKEPERRYQTAGELGRDIARYLAHEPIDAKRDSLIYYLRKRLRRNRVTVAAASAVLVACSAGLALSLYFWQQAEGQRVRAEGSEVIATRRADEARRVAEFQAALLGRVDPEAIGRSFREALQRAATSSGENSAAATEALERLARSASLTDAARETLTRTLLEPAEREIEVRFANQPEIEAPLRDTLADLYRGLGRYSEAERHVRRALELRRTIPDADLSKCLNRLGVILRESGKPAAAEAPQREAVAYAERQHGAESLEAAIALDNLAALLSDRGDHSEAEPLLRRALAVFTKIGGERHSDTLSCRHNLVLMLLARGELEQAEALATEVLNARREILPPNDPLISVTLRNLALIQFRRGNLDASEENLDAALQADRATHGNEHPDVAFALNSLGMLHMSRNRLEDAEARFTEALALQERLLGEEHPNTTTTRGNLGVLLVKRGQHRAAVPVLRQTLASWSALYGDDCEDVARTAWKLAEAYLGAGDTSAAEQLARRALSYYEQQPSAGERVTQIKRLIGRIREKQEAGPGP